MRMRSSKRAYTSGGGCSSDTMELIWKALHNRRYSSVELCGIRCIEGMGKKIDTPPYTLSPCLGGVMLYSVALSRPAFPANILFTLPPPHTLSPCPGWR